MRQARVCEFLETRCYHNSWPPTPIDTPLLSEASSLGRKMSCSTMDLYSISSSSDEDMFRPSPFMIGNTRLFEGSSQTSTLFKLPTTVRGQIYRLAGIITGFDIPLNPLEEYEGFPPPSRRPIRMNGHGGDVTRNLLLTCCQTYLDVAAIVYSENTFFISYCLKGSFKPLLRLSYHAVKSLKQLHIHKSSTWESCIHDDRVYHATFAAAPYKPYMDHFIEQVDEKTATRHWLKAAQCLQFLTPTCTSVSFSWEVQNEDDMETAKAVIQPFLSIPMLSSCLIRLSRNFNPQLKALATGAARAAEGTGIYQHDILGKLRLGIFSLPYEIRQQILELTDLVTPLREVEWSAPGIYHVRFAHEPYGLCCIGTNTCVDESCIYRKCPLPRHGGGSGCYCPVYHSTSADPGVHCRCWAPPVAIFLVNKALREEARSVFLRMNRFVILDYPSNSHLKPNVEEDHQHFATAVSFFTNAVPPRCFQWIRCIEIVLLQCHGGVAITKTDGFSRWTQVIRSLQDHANLPLLTLRLSLADHLLIEASTWHSSSRSPRPAIPAQVEPSEGCDRILALYASVVHPLASLFTLGGFVVSFHHEMCQTGHIEDDLSYKYRGVKAGSEKSNQIKVYLEQIVMGADYDSSTLTKEVRSTSQWLKDLEELY